MKRAVITGITGQDGSYLAELRKLGLNPDPFQSHEPNKPDQPHQPIQPRYDTLVLAVPHRAFRERSPEAYHALVKAEDGPGVLVDVKGVLPRKTIESAGIVYWSM